MKASALIYLGLFIALTGCTGMVEKNVTSLDKAQKVKSSGNNLYQTKNKSNPRTEHMMKWIELSKS